MKLESSTPATAQNNDDIGNLIRSLAATEAALEAALPAQVDAVINPTTATPILLHRAQAALQASEARYRHLLSCMAAIVFELEPDGTVLYVNETVREATGFSAQELLGKNWWETFFPGERRRQVDTLRTQFEHGDVSNYELTLTTRSGTLITLELNSANHYRSDGMLERFLGLGVDITERRRAERGRRFLGEASVVLASLLDYQVTIARIAQLAVPTLADWCMVHVVDKAGSIRQVAVTHVDAEKAARASTEALSYLPEPSTKSPVWKALETGRAELYPEVTDTMLIDRARDARHLEFLRGIGFASLMVVPLVARGKMLGVVQFVLSEVGRRFDASDLALAEELARRAAIAVDNSLLYEDAREQRARLQTTLSSIGDAAITTDAQGRVSFMNPVAQSLTGWTQDEAEGMALQQVFRIIDETSREPVENAVAKVIRGGTAVGQSNHSILVARDGTPIYIDNNGAPIRNDDGAIVGVILVFRNITERRKVQIALRDSEQRFRAIFDQAAVGMVESTTDGRWRLVNQRFCEMLGYSEQELVGHTMQEFTHPDDLAIQMEQTRQALAGERPTISLEKRYIRKDGSYLWAKNNSSLVRSLSDNQAYFVAIVEDITERKRVEEGLIASEGRYRRLFEAAQDGILILEANTGQIIDVNPFLAELLGYRHEEFLGKKLWEFGPFKDVQGSKAAFRELQDKQYIRYDDLPLETQDGRLIAVEFVSNSYQVDGQKVIQCNIRDITERKKAEEAMRQSEERFSKVFQLSPFGISISTMDDGHFLDFNESFLKVSGYSREEVMSRTAGELKMWVNPDERLTLFQELRDHGSVYDRETEFRTKSGAVRTMLLSLESLTLQGRLCLLSIAHDITERKQTVEVLRQSEARFASVFRLSPVGISLSAADDGRYIDLNESLLKLLGYSREEMIGRTADELNIWDAPEQRAAMTRAIRENGAVRGLEIGLRTKSGEVRMTLSSVELVVLNGQSCLLAVVYDITERRQAEEALATERNLLRTLIDNIPDAIYIKDRESRILIDNIQNQHNLGVSEPNTTAGKTDFDFLPHELAEEFFAVEQQIMRTGIALVDVEEINVDLQGNQGWHLSTKAPLRNAEGQIFGLVGISRDITERKQLAETEHEQRMLAEALRSTAAALTSTLDPNIVMVRILDSLDKVVPHDFANIMLIEGNIARAVHRRGYGPEVDGILETYHFPVEELPYLRQMRASGQPYLVADTNSDPDWAKLPMNKNNMIRSVIGVPIKAHGQVIGFLNLNSLEPNFFTSAHVERLQAFADQAAVAFENAQLYNELDKHATDLERRVVERTAALSRAKDHIEAILNNSSDAIVVTGVDGLINQKNPAFTSLFIDQPGEAMGQPITALATSDYGDRLLETFRRVVIDIQPAQLEIAARRRDGTFFDAEMAISPIAGPDGRTTSVVCSVRDISVHKQIEKELQDLNRLKTEFLSTAAHELRTPLTSILGFSEILLSRELDVERQRRYVRLINEQGTQLGELIDDLLDISRLEAKRGLSLHLELVNLDKLLKDVSRAFVESAHNHQILIEGLQDCCSPLIADSFRVAQVIKNLLSNAVKYSPKGGTITAQCQTLGAEVIISVRDQGLGLTPEQQTHMFEKFYRADASNRAIGGTGLGLAISKVIVELHGGRMWLESEYGHGTTFYFTLPLSENQAIHPMLAGANP